MIDFINRSSHMTIECDTCGEIAEFNGDFKYCVQEAKGNGWLVVKKKGEWHHYCSTDCKEGL